MGRGAWAAPTVTIAIVKNRAMPVPASEALPGLRLRSLIGSLRSRDGVVQPVVPVIPAQIIESRAIHSERMKWDGPFIMNR